VFHLTDKYLGTYITHLNFLHGKTVKESTDEFFYKDIVKVGTTQEEVTLKNGQKTNVESFVLKVSSGDSISVRDYTIKLEEKKGTKVIPTTPMEKHIQAIRTMLREKKT
ncbi:unnamed protein product, partial [marine sediment metagenome]